MKIPLLDLKRQYSAIKEDVDVAISTVLNSQSFIMGKELSLLEEEIASYCGTSYAVGVASGTDALLIALDAAGVGPEDEVITVPFTFIATAEAITNAGAKPVFVDIDENTYTMNPSLIERKITRKTKAIIPVHLYGQCADMDPIVKIARDNGIKVIEDCAQAIGATYKNNKAGSLADAGCISFFPSKNLGAYGDGGMIVTNDKDLAEKARLLRVHGSARRYEHTVIGYNSRLDNLQAAILRVKLKNLDKWSSLRRDKAKMLDLALKDIEGIRIPFVATDNVHVYHQYAIKVDSNKRDALIGHLREKGIESRVYYPIPLHLQECYKHLGYSERDFPVSGLSASSTLVLPVFPEIEDEEMDYVIDTVREFYKGS